MFWLTKKQKSIYGTVERFDLCKHTCKWSFAVTIKDTRTYTQFFTFHQVVQGLIEYSLRHSDDKQGTFDDNRKEKVWDPEFKTTKSFRCPPDIFWPGKLFLGEEGAEGIITTDSFTIKEDRGYKIPSILTKKLKLPLPFQLKYSQDVKDNTQAMDKTQLTQPTQEIPMGQPSQDEDGIIQ